MKDAKAAKAGIAALLIGSTYACAFAGPADPASAQPDQPVIGYEKGTVKTKCEGEPLAANICNSTDEHVRCLQLKNPGAEAVNCNVAIKATMNNLGTLHRAVYTATAHARMNAGANDWLCMSFDPILVNAGHDPRIWELDEIMAPEASCAPKQERPPCTEEQMKEGVCTKKQKLESYE